MNRSELCNAIKKQVAMMSRILLSVLACMIIATGASAAGVSGLTGKYSCLTNRNFAPAVAYDQGSSSTGANFMFTLDFDTQTAGMLIFLNSGWNTGSLSAKVVSGSGVSFTQSNGPVTGFYVVTVTFPNGGGSKSWNILPANSGNTLFLSNTGNEAPEPETGICQKQ